VPTSIEFMDNVCIKAAERFLERQLMFNQAAAFVIIELDGNSEVQLMTEMEMLADQCYQNNALDVLVGIMPLLGKEFGNRAGFWPKPCG